jgi:predicted transcriptional regulator
MPKTLIEIASEIVQAQVSLTPMPATDIASSLRQVFSALRELERAEEVGIESAPPVEADAEAPAEDELALTPQNSIRDDK